MHKLLLAVLAFFIGCETASLVTQVAVFRDTKCEVSEEELVAACNAVKAKWRDRYMEDLIFTGWKTIDPPEIGSYEAWHYHARNRTQPALVFLPAYSAETYGGFGGWPLAVVWTFPDREWLEEAILWELTNVFHPEDNAWAYE